MLTKEEGRFLVKIARKAVETYITLFETIKPPEDITDNLKKKRGVFVTLEKIEIVNDMVSTSLRGCIGFPEPIYPLIEATINAAIAAATQDPRFPPVLPDELDNIIFEVSVLTVPKKLEYDDPKNLPNMIKVGRDGLIVERGFFRGLLLPQVPVIYEWDEKEFLSQACFKAGLSPNAWLKGDVIIYTFQAQIFAEESPNGEVIEKILLVEPEDEYE